MPKEKKKIPRSKTTRNLFDKRKGVTVEFTSQALKEAVGEPERNGAWLIYGREKHGKTQQALRLAKDISQNEQVAYVSAEEGQDDSFIAAVQRAGITTADNIIWDEYLPIDLLIEKYQRPRSANVIVLDNLTVYEDEITRTELKKKVIDAFPNKLIIFVSHEERNEPFPAIAKQARKWAKVIFRVQGLMSSVTSRYSKGGTIRIDDETSELIWGDDEIIKQLKDE